MSPEERALAERCRQDPAWWIRTFLGGDPWEAQVRIAESVRDHVRTAVKACHAPGKTWLAARVVLWFLCSHYGARVLTTAPTWRQVENVLWREVRAAYEGSRVQLPGHLFKTAAKGLEIGELWHAMGFSTKDPDKVSGFHAPYLLIVVDEASGVPDGLWEALRGLMASGHVRILLLGNPTRPAGEFYAAFNAKAALYNRIELSAWDTPNLAPLKPDYDRCRSRDEKLALLRGAPVYHQHLVSAAWVADMLEEFGEDSSIFAVRVLGRFPHDDPEALVPLHLVEAAATRWEELVDSGEAWFDCPTTNSEPVELGVDVARYGDAESVLLPRAGPVAARMQVYRGKSTDELADLVGDAHGVYQPKTTRIDAVGIGAGVFDQCRRKGLRGLVEFNGGFSPRNPERFANLRAEVFWALRQRYERGDIAHERDERLIGQVSSLKHKTGSKAGRSVVVVESKDDMRKRGVVSPDRADALSMAYAGGGESTTRSVVVEHPPEAWRHARPGWGR